MIDWDDIDPQDRHRISHYVHQQHFFEDMETSAIQEALRYFIRKYLPRLLSKLEQVVQATFAWIREQLGYRPRGRAQRLPGRR